MLGGGKVKRIYELKGEGRSIRDIARTVGVARNTVRKYVRSAGIPKAKQRAKRGSKLDPYRAHVQRRLAEGVENCVLLLRELRAQGYAGSYTILKEFVKPFRRRREVKATMRFETEPGEQAQVDLGHFRYRGADGRERHVWAFVMVLSWSRAMQVEFVGRADEATFIRCHLNAFERLGGQPRRCLYDNAKVVVLGRDDAGEPLWNRRFLDFALRLGFSPQVCRPYRAQTKGRVESGIKYLRHNFWPVARFSDLADLNRQAGAWCTGVANARQHGTTGERPADRLARERAYLVPLPGTAKLVPFRREERKVGRDGYVQWEGSCYGVPWRWAGTMVQLQAGDETVEVFSGEERIAVHPRAREARKRLPIPGQWAGLPSGDGRARREALAVQVPAVEVEHRPLELYDALAGGVSIQ